MPILILVFAVFVPFLSAHAAVKDTDQDGLTDQAEEEVYGTSPTTYDTDGDSVSDGQEVLMGTDPLTPDAATPARISLSDAPLAWYIGRASGILAFILLTIVVVNGLLISTRLVAKFLPPALNYELHRFVSWAAILAIVGHIASFTFDKYIHLTWLEALVPFSWHRNFTSALGISLGWSVGIGTLAFYLIAALIITSELKNKVIPLKAWRALHYSSFVAYLLFLGHGIFAGTDTREWWMMWIYALSATLVFSLTAIRIVTAIKKKRSGIERPIYQPEPRPATPEPPTRIV